jgi:hypothetical protein
VIACAALTSLASGLSSVGKAVYAIAAVAIVLILALLILALRGVGPDFERGKKTRFRLVPIREKRPKR